MTRKTLLTGITGTVLTVFCFVTVFNGGVLAPILPAAKTMFDTVLALASLVSGVLFAVRYKHVREVCDAACAYGFTLLGIGSVVLAFARSLVGPHTADALTLAFACRVVGLVIIALAALEIPRGRVATGAGPLLYGVLVATTLVVVTVAGLVAPDIQRAVDAEAGRTLILRSSQVPWVTSTVNAAVMSLLALAAYACRLRRRTDGDAFIQLLGVGFALLAFARLYLLLYPGTSGSTLHVGDLCRLVGTAVILWNLVAWLVAHWKTVAVRSAVQAQQSAAAELHDGIAQELALLSAQSSWLSKRSDDSEELAFVAVVAERALAESRRTISRLRGVDTAGGRDRHGPSVVIDARDIDDRVSR